MAVAALFAFGIVLRTPPPANAAPAEPQTGQRVTLITGDRVVVRDAKQDVKTIVPGKGRSEMAFSTYERGEQLFVVPRDAVPLVRQGKLDERLFDVTTLLDSGYGDSKRATLPLSVTHTPGMTRAPLAGTEKTRSLASINATAVSANRDGSAWQSLLGPSVRKVWLDSVRHLSLDRSVPQIGGPEAWKAGYTGAGVKVAVLDSGVDETHPDLEGRQVAERNFGGAADNVDRYGHGTHVASIVAGTGAKSGGKVKGVAYDAQILDGKVFDDQGRAATSWIIAGMQWAVEQDAKVVNMSLGGLDYDGVDPLEEAVNELSKTGTLFVVAAGNLGADGTVSSPGSADAALTVGAVDREDDLASFSSRGPRVGDGAIKPDITAPGVGIVAAKSAESQIGTPAGDGYVALSGTSMATPHVAGSAALLAQEHPKWTGQQLKAALTASAKPNDKLDVFAQGSGRVDVARAIGQVVTTAPTNVSLGTQLWPHDDDQPVTKTVTYHNAGATGVTLDLAVSATGPDGQPAPASMLTPSAPKATIPAGGTASVDVVGDTRLGSLDGTFSGVLTATSGGTQVRTPVVVTREGETHTLTLNHTGLDGQPATADYGTVVYNIDTGEYHDRLFSPDGRLSVRLPKGHYLVDSVLAAERTAWLVHPSLDLTRDLSVDLDFRAARQTKITPPDNATLDVADVRYARYGDSGVFGFSWVRFGGDLSDLWTAGLGPKLPSNKFVTQYNTQWIGDTGDFYGLGYYANGSFPTGFTRADRKKDLGRVHTTYAVPLPGRSGLAWSFPHPKSGPSLGGWSSTAMPVSLPGERYGYYSPDARWVLEAWQMNPDQTTLEQRLITRPRTVQAGRTIEVPFNRGVFGLALPESTRDADYLTRAGNKIRVNIPLWGDAAGNMDVSAVDRQNMVLYKDGVKVGESTYGGDEFNVPSEPGNYTLVTEGVRSLGTDVSTTVRLTCTFHSGPTGPTWTRLPLSVLRFTPKLDDNNSVPAGGSLIVPVRLQQQATNTSTVPRTLKVDASFDRGLTWTPVTVLANALAVVKHPDDATSVSLRAKATDAAGDSVEQKLINAYKLH